MNIATSTDLKFGLGKELDIKEALETFFKCKLEKTSKFNKMDFKNLLKKIYIEIKSRRFKKNKYKTTFLNLSKIEYSNELLETDKETKIYFIFNFTDGIFYIQYDEYLFSTFSKQNTYLLKRNAMVFNYLIPVDKLIKI
jgi:hypothetical protein